MGQPGFRQRLRRNWVVHHRMEERLDPQPVVVGRGGREPAAQGLGQRFEEAVVVAAVEVML